MRTTLDVDDDVLAAVKELAETKKTTAGKVLSDLVRKAILSENQSTRSRKRNGFILMPKRKKGRIVTMELVNRLRDEE